MSKAREKFIKFDPSVKVEIQDRRISVSGTKGELSLEMPADLRVEIAKGEVKVSLLSQNRALFGLYVALISNLIAGVTSGFKKSLEMVGIGYKAKKEGRDLVLTVGYSHPLRYTPAEGCEIEVSEDLKITVAGINKELVGQVAAEIRQLKKPEPYKGKGIKYSGEVVRRKAGKAGKVGVVAK